MDEGKNMEGIFGYPGHVISPHEEAVMPLLKKLLPNDGRRHRIEIIANYSNEEEINIDSVVIYPHNEP